MFFTLLGSLLGGVFRLAPEVLKWLDRKDDRKHEVEMFDLQIKADELRGKLELDKADAAISAAEMQGLIEATKIQGQLTGVKWVDAVNALMRPLITFWWVICLETAALAAGFITLLNSGMNATQAILSMWGTDEKSIVASIISFWFMDRALRKQTR